MIKNRPWNVWWDFRWHEDKIKWILVQCDHPSYDHVDYIYQIPIELCRDENGFIDSWCENNFNNFRNELISGRISIHTLMKKLGHEKRIQANKKR